jgi:hydrogenase maturation protein HypF
LTAAHGVQVIPSQDQAPAAGTIAVRVEVTGLVQGVGFRPFVHRLAIRHALAGWVRNATGVVEIHLEGEAAGIGALVDALRHEAPVLARLDTVTTRGATVEGLVMFEVRSSVEAAEGRLPVSPDVATCAACLRELADPANRRHRYPFITCTDCGPRFTVIAAMPYDRERTSMRVFTQCPSCLREYTTPGDRRYHSETNSCHLCGPRLWFESVPRGGDGAPDPRRHATADVAAAASAAALAAAGALLRHGGILAVRGLGGFHLAADATNEAAVTRLRERKRREAKPLAVMVATLDDARVFSTIDEHEAVVLRSAARPIVLVPVRRDGPGEAAPVARPAAPLTPHASVGCAPAAAVAPGLAHVGVMLAYTPLHHLLLEAVGRPLVMTSGNRSEEPIATGTDEARRVLADIADGFLLHDREIVARYDDSVVRVVDGAPVFLRRARGYAPIPIDLPIASPRPLLAVGPHLKNTFTLLHGARAFTSQHVGDLDSVETLAHWHASLERFRQLFRIEPEVVIADRHPGYLSTRLAEESGLESLPPAQHHHAHIAAVLAEQGRTDPVIGVAYDGTGLGDDGAIWGAEILLADLAGYRRLGHMRYAPLAGADAAVRAPWRVAAGWTFLDPDADADLARARDGVDPRAIRVVERQLERNVNVSRASSMGRLFDAAAAVLGVRREQQYEGQAAMELEALAGTRVAAPLPFLIGETGDGLELDPLPALRALGRLAQDGEDVHDLAAAFHETVVSATTELVRLAAGRTHCRTVALGGGCFQNARLVAGVRAALRTSDFEVLVPRHLSPNDGAVSLGQAAIGAATLSGATTRTLPSPVSRLPSPQRG